MRRTPSTGRILVVDATAAGGYTEGDVTEGHSGEVVSRVRAVSGRGRAALRGSATKGEETDRITAAHRGVEPTAGQAEEPRPCMGCEVDPTSRQERVCLRKKGVFLIKSVLQRDIPEAVVSPSSARLHSGSLPGASCVRERCQLTEG